MKVVHAERLSLLKKIFMVDLIKGLLLTFSYQRPSANYTEQYPKVRPKMPQRYRGAPSLNNDHTDRSTRGTGCHLVSLSCHDVCM